MMNSSLTETLISSIKNHDVNAIAQCVITTLRSDDLSINVQLSSHTMTEPDSDTLPDTLSILIESNKLVSKDQILQNLEPIATALQLSPIRLLKLYGKRCSQKVPAWDCQREIPNFSSKDPQHTQPLMKWLEIVSSSVIIISLIFLSLETLPNINSFWRTIFSVFEIVTLLFFSIEYIFNTLSTCVGNENNSNSTLTFIFQSFYAVPQLFIRGQFSV